MLPSEPRADSEDRGFLAVLTHVLWDIQRLPDAPLNCTTGLTRYTYFQLRGWYPHYTRAHGTNGIIIPTSLVTPDHAFEIKKENYHFTLFSAELAHILNHFNCDILPNTGTTILVHDDGSFFRDTEIPRLRVL